MQEGSTCFLFLHILTEPQLAKLLSLENVALQLLSYFHMIVLEANQVMVWYLLSNGGYIL